MLLKRLKPISFRPFLWFVKKEKKGEIMVEYSLIRDLTDSKVYLSQIGLGVTLEF